MLYNNKISIQIAIIQVSDYWRHVALRRSPITYFQYTSLSTFPGTF